jgi:thiamine biosynthesis lipoprotein
MTSERKTTRREFLKGRSAGEALYALTSGGAPPTPASAAVPSAARSAPSYLVQITRQAMATDFQVYLNAGQHEKSTEAALAALDLIEALERQLTVYREHSEVMDINRRAAEGPVVVEARLFALIQLAVRLHRETEGAFDITSGPLSKVWGFYRREGAIPAAEALQDSLERVGTQWLELDEQAQTVRFLKRGVEINFNALGKGYALDRAAERLRDAGAEHFLIHGGQSSVVACGTRAGSDVERPGWLVEIRHPLRRHKGLAEVRLHDRAMGTSSAAIQFFRHKGRRYGHILDPRTGWPAERVLSATVLAPTGALADALSTAFFVMGREKAEAYCQSHPDISAILLCRGERVGSTELHAIGLSDDLWRAI